MSTRRRVLLTSVVATSVATGRALYRFDLPEARTRLRRALALDSTFALAHHHLAMVQEFSERPEDRDTARVHEKAAQALARARFYVDTAMAVSSWEMWLVNDMNAPVLWPRMMLLRADLAAARGLLEIPTASLPRPARIGNRIRA